MRKRKRLENLRVWVDRHKKALMITGGLFFALIIVAQLFYPQDRALPFTALNNNSVFWKERSELAARIHADFLEATVTIEAGDKKAKIALTNAGATPNTDEMIDALMEYPLWQRLIPFSLVVKQPRVNDVDVYFDSKRLEEIAGQTAKKLALSPTDAHLAIENGALTVTKAKTGFTVDKAVIVQALSTSHLGFTNTSLSVATKTVNPARSDGDIAPVKAQAEAAIAKKITIKGPDDTAFTPDSAMIASWLAIDVDDSGKESLRVDSSRLEEYANSINDKVKIDPGVTTVEIVDGEEVTREGGSTGREVVVSTLVDQLRQTVESGEQSAEITLEIRPVVSVAVNSRVYTSSQKGLQAYVDYVTSIQDVHISLVQLDGNRWTAESRAHDSIPSGSTFKVWVALVLFDKMQKGEIHWEDPMLDTTVAGCFERMTVASTNPCAESWIAQFGRQYINDFIYARGFSTGTNFFTNGVAISTTAADLTKYMIGLYDGSLVGGQYRDRLLDSLGRHPYRYGVPTGSIGVVHDKVGFLWDYVHDAAIVQHPRGTYVVTIMTRGQSYGRIAQITRELESIMYP